MASSIERVALHCNEFSENWLQKLIHENPSLLPISEIESGFAPAISMGREIKTNAGFIDNLFISPEGYLTIVETKLWRNPQARREVVGQIIDYAKELSKWTFSELDSSLRNSVHISDGLIAKVRKQPGCEDIEEHTLIDNINKNLRRGRILLLIVGDGIRESVEEMVAYLSQSPQLHFTLALVELQVYRLGDSIDPLLVIPQVVTRTREITRAVVRVEGDYSTGLTLNIDSDLGTEPETLQRRSSGRTTLSAQDYFEQLLQNTNSYTAEFVKKVIADSQQIGLTVEWNTSSFGLQFPDPAGSGLRISIMTFDKRGQIMLGYAEKQLEALGIPSNINHRFCADSAAIFIGLAPNPLKLGSWNRKVAISELIPLYDRFMKKLEAYLDEIANPRMTLD
ncbi:hypothetical protein J2Y45_000392 [Dyadobacter sp. BE34]|uniref:DUF4268 domain-containing protein n=1 Tax=Dyadobacter fermentans TaxID=94254 RepID=A0ABU1QPT6_9BACT|nr:MULTISPECIES: hypothetical protein [Dyadobacter]MDR6803122.1 hypothetical protein [Dyadobacter fermentans]MDR7040864.1 hypothetical protein [Dyadobacter sp. BE242]MDR7195266.1 hypothetical protein [Dyadobacter sp. BE34]MDR7214188.1 hypothetical protein [Dyadobacter sp. BE31]MDR7260674.1 hypothetical protein [Dyadobacter sp. BE32]